MALGAVKNGSGSHVHVFCDHCGKMIEFAKDGNYLWQSDMEQAGIFFFHKKCSRTVIKNWMKVGVSYLSDELERFPLYLAVNLNIPVEFDGETENVVPEYKIIVKYPAYKI